MSFRSLIVVIVAYGLFVQSGLFAQMAPASKPKTQPNARSGAPQAQSAAPADPASSDDPWAESSVHSFVVSNSSHTYEPPSTSLVPADAPVITINDFCPAGQPS